MVRGDGAIFSISYTENSNSFGEQRFVSLDKYSKHDKESYYH